MTAILPDSGSAETAIPSSHWLSRALVRGGMPAAAGLELTHGMSTKDAWGFAARVLQVKPDVLAECIARGLRIRLADFSTTSPVALRLIPESLARRHNVFPLSENDREIVVATADPHNISAEQALGFASGRRAVLAVAPPLTIAHALDNGYVIEHTVDEMLSKSEDDISDTVRVLEELEPEIVAEEEVQSGPVVKLTNMILRTAVTSGASDIHIEPGSPRGKVRMRVDGVLRTHMHLASKALNRVVSRIKVLSKLDISDRLRPQDGRARIEVDGKAYDLRVSTVPIREAEKVVVRVLRPDSARGLDDCGVSPYALDRMRQLLSQRDGIVIVTGPTGSGKTTTLYSAIKEIASEEVNVMTVEDPVEYELPGITQMQVETKRNLTFASALRAILRQDPDVIFVGEIRDGETAQVAAQAALTGHLVLATMHTNDAMGAVARLVDLGLDRATIAACIRGVVAQRLVRRICEDCAQPVGDTMTEQEQRLATRFGMKPTRRSVGCKSCAESGYRGRMPINEVAIVTPEIAEMIATGAPAASLQRGAVDAGMRLLRDDAIERAKDGRTTLQELERVIGDVATRPIVPVDARTESETQGRLLVVDDDRIIRHIAKSTLEAAGFAVEAVENGTLALKALEGVGPWDLVLTDLDMPELNGAELLRAIRSNEKTSSLPVIVLTGTEEHEREVELIEAGANDYMHKPIDPPRLIARIRAALRRAGHITR